MKLYRSLLLSAMMSAVVSLAVSRANADDIVDIAAGAPNFKTLVAAIKAAGLVDTLKSAGPFTVFAPTDAAFARLPKGTLEMLLKPENRDRLTSLLTYHVVKGKVLAADVAKLGNGARIHTVNTKPLKVRLNQHGVFINKSRVIKTDIEADNGVIHVIDAVLIPPAGRAR